MLAGVISRDEGCPWGTSGQTSATWLTVPVKVVQIRNLIATQPGLLWSALIAETTPVGADRYPHVIEYEGKQYLEDGHHRVARAALRGKNLIAVRYLVVT